MCSRQRSQVIWTTSCASSAGPTETASAPGVAAIPPTCRVSPSCCRPSARGGASKAGVRLKAGAKAYVLKDIGAEGLVGCIRDVLAGKTYLAPSAAAKLAERVTRVQLTPREMAALRLMADGKANKEIASELGRHERTVRRDWELARACLQQSMSVAATS